METIKKLNSMGASFFIMYTYYIYIDKNEIRWQNCKSVKTRVNTYKQLSNADIKVLLNEDYSNKIVNNNFGISRAELIEMQNKLKDIFSHLEQISLKVCVKPSNYTAKKLIKYLNDFNEINKEVFNDFDMHNGDMNIEVKSITEGCWILELAISIAMIAGEELLRKIIDDYYDKIKKHFKNKIADKNEDNSNITIDENKKEK